MFFPMMDYQSTEIVITNSGSKTFTAPYKCMIVISDIKLDDTASGSIRIRDLQVRQSGAPTEIDFLTIAPGGNTALMGTSYILRSGQRLLIDSNDDFNVRINYFRLP